jgi:hypothetical protein
VSLGILLTAMTIASVPLPPPTETFPVRGGLGRCEAPKARTLVGRKRGPRVEAEARRLTGATVIRWVPKGAMVTMDHREDRLNLHLDHRGRILTVSCG